MIEANAVYVIVAREFKKFVREKSRLISTIARPLVWLFLVGGGMSRLVPTEGGVSYMQFIFPGQHRHVLFLAVFHPAEPKESEIPELIQLGGGSKRPFFGRCRQPLFRRQFLGNRLLRVPLAGQRRENIARCGKTDLSLSAGGSEMIKIDMQLARDRLRWPGAGNRPGDIL